MNKPNINSAFLRGRPFLILSVPFMIFILMTQLKFNPFGDEYIGHIQTIRDFASSFPFLSLKDYSASSGPLSFILWTVFGKIVGFEIWKLRFLTALFSYFGSLIFFSICRDQKTPYPLLKTFCLIFFPYIFLHSFTLYTINLTLFWELMSLRSFLRYKESQSNFDLACGSLSSLALVFSRQVDVALPVGVFCFFLAEKRLRKLSGLLGSMIPIIGLFLLFLYWGRITPYKGHQELFSPSFKLTQLTFLFTVLGFYFQPVGIYEGMRLGKWAGFVLLMVPFLLVFAVPYPKEGLGIVYYGIDLVGKTLHHNSSLVLSLYLGLMGSLVLYGISKGIYQSGRPSLPVYVLLSYVLLNCLNPVVYERYYYFAWPLILLLWPRNVSENRLLSVLVLGIHIGVSIFYVKLSLVFPK